MRTGPSELYKLYNIHIRSSDIGFPEIYASDAVELRLSKNGNPEWLGPSRKFVENSTKRTCLEITGYRIKYNTVLWLIELKIRRGRKY